jgi:hypothetical protein
MTDELIRLRSRRHRDVRTNEAVVARILCYIVLPIKPRAYVGVMQTFRVRFRGIAADGTLQALFRQAIRRPALVVAKPDDVVFQADLYFDLEDGDDLGVRPRAPWQPSPEQPETVPESSRPELTT